MLPIAAPIRASEISAEVELTPPTSDGAEVQENVTKANVVDIQRYLRWADKAMQSRSAKEQGSTKDQGSRGSKAA